MPPGDERQAFEATSEIPRPPAAIPVPGLRPGTVLGQYQLLERIGAGGMGEVFKAVHPTMQRVVAVKIMTPALVQDPRARARFRREVQSAARLAHPNIVMAFDAAEEAGRCFLVMEYVEGRDAAALLAEFGPPPIAVTCDVIVQAALGLQHAHEQGMVHRDVKPANLMIAARRPRGGAAPDGWPAEPLVKVLDFGLARFQAGASDATGHVAGSTPLTREGHVVGTPEFMAPEQARNSGLTDIRSDIYSLGCSFYCLLTGRPPFVGPSLLEVMVQHLQSAPPPVSRSRPDVPDAVVTVLQRMLAKRPEERYRQPAEVAAALRPWVAAAASPTEVVAAGPPVQLYPQTRPDGTPQVPSARPAATALMTPAPRPGVVVRALTATARVVFGCLALFFLLLASMVAGWVYLARADKGDSAAVAPDAPAPLAGIELVRFPADRLTAPSYASEAIDIRSGFGLASREATCGQFGAFVQATGYKTDAEKGVGGRGALVLTGDGKGGFQESATWRTWRSDPPDDTPVTCVTWEDAVRFCNWLSDREHLKACYQQRGGSAGWDCDFRAAGYRLPSEAEWEYAARASRTTLYPERPGELLRHGWFRENSDGGPHAVGSAPERTPHGLADVWGNVWEWCWERYAPPSSERVARGGSWCDPAPVTAAQTRQGFAPDYRANNLGFRVARTMADP